MLLCHIRARENNVNTERHHLIPRVDLSMSTYGAIDAISMNFNEKTFISIMFVHEIELTIKS